MDSLLRIAFIALALLISARINASEVVIPSDISVHLSAQPVINLEPGEPIVFTLTIINHGPQPVEHATLISSDFFDQIDLSSGGMDCPGFFLSVTDGETFNFNYWWDPTLLDGPLAIGESRSCQFTRAMTSQSPLAWPFSFELLGYYEDINPANNISTVILRRGDIAPTAIPMLSPTVMLLLAIALATTACCAFRERSRREPGGMPSQRASSLEANA
ncbi:MAG: hypothetical protein WAS23_01540 [Dokdonella sp.]|uniref:hypothetical protein n=2 Tax=Dokdonella sp. TaxID=2291710 RepID=UPI002C1C5879|nr:hypothetical protein [Dokdonella sp.]HOX70901.1 hypothetical protein [Dokdonella sp.]